MRLEEEARRAFVRSHPGWEIDGETLRRTFVFPDFGAAIGFVVRVAIAAEAADHHPDVDIRWNTVTLVLTTHSESALTDRDTTLASTVHHFA